MPLSSHLPLRHIATVMVAMAYLAFTLATLPAMALPHPTLSRGGTVGSYEAAERGEYLIGGTVVGVTVTDPRGRSRDIRFNPKGVARESTDNRGQSTQYVRDAADRVTRATDVLGRVSRYGYDSRGNLTGTVDPLGRLVDIQYDAIHNKPTVVTRYLQDGTPIVWQMSYHPTRSKRGRVRFNLLNK